MSMLNEFKPARTIEMQHFHNRQASTHTEHTMLTQPDSAQMKLNSNKTETNHL